MPESSWSAIENGRSRRSDGSPSRPSPDTLRKIARGLGVPEADVFAAAGYIPAGNDRPDWWDDYVKVRERNPDGVNGAVRSLIETLRIVVPEE